MRPYLACAVALVGAALIPAWQASVADTSVRSLNLPPYSKAYEPRTVDERGMWMEADEAERVMRDSKLVIRDDELNAYVRGVLCRTVGTDRCGSVRIYVLRIPQFNATMYPNGMMTVWSGLLLRMKTEAELGAVLGHEFGHYELRHTLAGFQKARTATDVMAWLQVLGGFSGQNTTASQAAIIGSFYSFNRAQETDADLIGLSYLAKSDYPSSAAANVWERLMAEQDATAAGRKQRVKRRYVAGFAASHPTELSRALYLRSEAAKIGDVGDPMAEGYRAGIAKWFPTFLDDQIKLNDFGGSEYLFDTLAQSGWSAELLYARARLYFQRGNPRDLVSAAQFFQDAIAKGATEPEAYRDLGLCFMKIQQSEAGRTQLKRYLELKPAANDAGVIRTLIGS